jgi:hypothetical protein
VKALDARIAVVRDIAMLRYSAARYYYHYFVVEYRSTQNDEAFFSAAELQLLKFYQLESVKGYGMSLFRDLDIDVVESELSNLYSPSGLRVVPYHYYEHPLVAGQPIQPFPHFAGERPGGWYEVYNKLPDGTYDPSEFVYKEFANADGTATIRRLMCESVSESHYQPVSYEGSNTPYDDLYVIVGRREQGMVTFSPGMYVQDLQGITGILRCFWAVENEGSVPVGSFGNDVFGVRSLPRQPDCVFTKGARFEQYL